MGDLITGGLSSVLSFLPDSPFKMLNNLVANTQIGEWLGMLNWFIPIYSFVGIFVDWLICVGLYYVYQIALRWLNAIE